MKILLHVYYQSLKGYDIVAAAPDTMKSISSRIFMAFIISIPTVHINYVVKALGFYQGVQ